MIWLVVGVVAILGVIVVTMIRKDDPFQVAATELGIKLTRTVPDLLPRLDGLVGGVAVKLDILESRDPQLRYRTFYPALGMALRLERETTISRTLGQLGSGDQQIGAKPFDDSFRVNTSRPDALRTMMTPELRRKLIRLIEQHPRAVVSDGDITITGDNLDPPAETIVATIRSMVATVHDLTAARPPALQTPETRPAPVAAEPTPPAPAPKVSSESGTLPPTGPASEQEPVPAPATVREPPSKAKAPPTTQPTGLPPNFFEDVFGAGRLSFEDDDRFEQEIRGRQVTLSGTVKQASPYAGDDDLSKEAGIKAVVRVAQIEIDLYGKSDIDAVVFLSDPATTKLSRGDAVTFSGKVERVDPFMRNLFVVSATLS